MAQSKRILVVRADFAAIDVVKEIVSDACQDKGIAIDVLFERNRAAAEERLRAGNGYDLVIVDANVPEDKRDAVRIGDERRLGVSIVENLRLQQRATPAIVITSANDERLNRQVQLITRATVTLEGNDFAQELAQQSLRWLTNAPTTATRLDVEIYLGDDRNTCTYKLRGHGGMSLDDGGPLKIDADLLGLVDDSRSVGDIETTRWESQLRKVGEELAKSIFTNNQKFTVALAVAEGFMRGAGEVEPKVRLRFTVDPKLHPIAVEAIVDEQQKYWMLRAPVFRRLRLQGSPPTFASGTAEPINCLIIEADAYGRVDSTGKDLPRLRHVTEEARRLEDLFESKKSGDIAIGKVRRFPKDQVEAGSAPSFSKALSDVLKNDSWHVVHFVGHSIYDSEKRQGYIALPGPGGKVETVSSDQFARWLAGSSFVYLSSCESSEEGFVFEMANARVPAVAGFRWKIDDAEAPEYAIKFYDHLLDDTPRMCLEEAFFKARCDLHSAHPDKKVWAAPVLVMQSAD